MQGRFDFDEERIIKSNSLDRCVRILSDDKVFCKAMARVMKGLRKCERENYFNQVFVNRCLRRGEAMVDIVQKLPYPLQNGQRLYISE